VRVTPIYQYRGYGEYKPDRDKAVLAQADAAPNSGTHVVLWQETLPPGIAVGSGGSVKVLEGYSHVLIGKLAYSMGKMLPKVTLIAKAKAVIHAAGGDFGISLFRVTDPKNYEQAMAIKVVVIKKDPRMNAPAPKDPPSKNSDGLLI